MKNNCIKIFACIILSIFVCVSTLYAQSDVEHSIQLAVGGSIYSGEIGGANTFSPLDEWNFATPRPLFKASYKNTFHAHWAAKGSFGYFNLAATDENKDIEIPTVRSFKTHFFEAEAVVEFNAYTGNLNELPDKFYLFAGVGAIFGLDVTLQRHTLPPTSRHTKPDPAIFFPLGFGYQLDFERISIGAEAFWQITTTDYLDGHRSANYPDLLGGINLIVSYRFGNTCKTCNSGW